MKKILLFILILANVCGYSQTIRFTNQVRQTRVGGIYRLQIDSSYTGDFRNLATENYVQWYFGQVQGTAYSAGQGLALTGTTFSLNSLGGYVQAGANVTISGLGTASSPFVIAATGTGGTGANANIGSGYRWVQYGTQNVKTYFNGYALLTDSTTNANALTTKLDSATLFVTALRRKDSVAGGYYPYSSNPLSYTTSSFISSNYVPQTTLVSTGYGLLGGGALNANRTHFVDTSVIDTKLWRQKGIDSVVALLSSYMLTSNFNSSFDTRLATKTTTNLAEGANQYYTNARARAALSLSFTTTGTSGAATGSYNNSTGVLTLNIPQYSGGGLGGSLVVSLTDGATINTDASLGYVVGASYRVTLAGNRTIANPTNVTDGQRIVYEIHQDATGSRTVTWGSKFAFSDDIPIPTLSTTASSVDFVSFVYNQSEDKWRVTGVNRGGH